MLVVTVLMTVMCGVSVMMAFVLDSAAWMSKVVWALLRKWTVIWKMPRDSAEAEGCWL